MKWKDESSELLLHAKEVSWHTSEGNACSNEPEDAREEGQPEAPVRPAHIGGLQRAARVDGCTNSNHNVARNRPCHVQEAAVGTHQILVSALMTLVQKCRAVCPVATNQPKCLLAESWQCCLCNAVNALHAPCSSLHQGRR